MANPALRFLLHDIDENEARKRYAFDVLEPKVIIEVEGRNAFEAFGISDSGPVVIMDFLIEALDGTLRMFQQLEHGVEDEAYEFELTASLFILALRRRRTNLEVVLVDEGKDPAVSHLVGRVTVRDWAQAIMVLAKEILDLFRRVNLELYGRLSEDAQKIEKLDAWLASQSH